MDEYDWTDGFDPIDEESDEIERREAELQNSLFDFLCVLSDDYYDIEDNIEDILDHMCEYVTRKHKMSVYRPMFLEDEDGKEFFEEFPYECMIFDDEDNPIYK